MNIIKSTIRIASVALAMLTAGILQTADAAQEWQKGPSDAWFVKWDEAVAESKKTQKPIFVLKTGSDWCGWCIRLRKNVLSKPEFEDFAKKNLVLLYLDSPSKTPLCAEQKKHNQEVSRKLSLGGGVPNASVVTADGKKLGSISGGGLGLEDYLKKLNAIIGGADKANAPEMRSPSESLAKNEKLPLALMPKEGRIADFDFDGNVSNRVSSAGKLSLPGLQLVDGALYSPGDYKNCYRIGLPELRYDGLTVALSFKPEGVNRGNWIPVFSFGEPAGSSIRWFNSSISQGGMLEFGFNAYEHTIKTGIRVKLNEWNHLICSVDAVNGKVLAVVNGEVGEWNLPAGFGWRFSHSRSREECRCIGFSNRNFGLVYKGYVDDFLVYDHAFGKDALTAIANGRKPVCKGTRSACPKTDAFAESRRYAIPAGKWLFVPVAEKSLYWNGEIRDGNWILETRREGAEITVLPQYTRGRGKLDLEKPVVDEQGNRLDVVGIGYSRGGNRCLYSPKVTEIVLPRSLKHIYQEAFSWCKFSSVTIPDGVVEIGEQAFSSCASLKSVDIPASVERIDGGAFANCGSLLSIRVRGPAKINKHAFGGSTPAACKIPAGTKTGPFTAEVVRPAELAYALNGRMTEPFLNNLRFGDSVSIGGCGSIRFTRCPEIADRMDTSYHKVGPELVCGSSACWVISEDVEGADVKSRRSMELAFKMLSETFSKIKLNPIKWKSVSDWPSSVDGLDSYYGRQGRLYRAIAANDFSECVASARTEADGYRIDFRVWGSKGSKTVFLSFDIVDTIMQRAWGVEP